jgi:hypothetical protein
VARDALTGVAIATRGDGGFVAVWEAGWPGFVRARAFGPDHEPLGREVVVDRLGTLPAVAVKPSGEFVVAWQASIPAPDEYYSEDDDLPFVAVRRFAADGSPVGAAQAASAKNQGAFKMLAGTDGDGNFLVIWGSAGRRFAADGTPLTRILRLHLDEIGSRASSLAVGLRGNFVLAWERPTPSGNAIFTRRFATDGSPLGPAIQVNGVISGNPYLPQVAIGADGGFIVTWESYDRESGPDVFARRFRRR